MVALQIERIHGADGATYIEGRRKHFEEFGEEASAALWQEIASKFDALNPA